MTDADFYARVKAVEEVKEEYDYARRAAFRALCACGLFARRAREIAQRQSDDDALSEPMQRLLETWVPRVADIGHDLNQSFEPSMEFYDADGETIGDLVWRQRGDENTVWKVECDDTTLEDALCELLPSVMEADDLTDLCGSGDGDDSDDDE